MKTKSAFTLIELMIVVAIIGILVAIAFPKFTGLIDKSKEGATKGGLTTLRSALGIYYGDTLAFPTDNLDSLVAARKYLENLPTVKLPRTSHPESRQVTVGSSTTSVTDTGGWLYVNDTASHEWGTALINCTHQDVKGNNWDEQ